MATMKPEEESLSKLPRFQKVAQVGEGTYGKVYKAKDLRSGNLVALKRIRLEMEKEGFPLTAMRETRLLQRVKHENILNVLDMIYSRGFVYMVFEYLSFDLNGLLAHPAHRFEEMHVKCILTQILNGMFYLHSNDILHRDVKGSNILIGRDGVVKIADFGLARIYTHLPGDCTNRVITMWYRPPELLLGSTNYGPEVDIWGIGCLFLEMFTRRPIFSGADEVSQLQSIIHILGNVDCEEYLSRFPWSAMVAIRRSIGAGLESVLPKNCVSSTGLDLARKMLSVDSSRRISARDALSSTYFKEEPRACPPAGIPTPDVDWHEFEAKQERKRGDLKRKAPTTVAA